MTAAMAVSLMVIDITDPKEGSILTTACGIIRWRTTWALDMPRAKPAPVCPALTDSIPERTISATKGAMCMVSAMTAAQKVGIEMPSNNGKAKNVHTSTTSTGMARIESM